MDSQYRWRQHSAASDFQEESLQSLIDGLGMRLFGVSGLACSTITLGARPDDDDKCSIIINKIINK